MKVSGFTWAIQWIYMIVLFVSDVLAKFSAWLYFIRDNLFFKKSFAYLRGTYYDKYRERTHGVKVKFDVSNLIIIFMLGVFFLASDFPLSNLTTFLILVSIAYFVLTLIYIIFKTYYRLDRFVEVIQKMKNNWSMVFYTLMIIILAFLLTGFNRIWFVLFIPGLLCKMIDIAFSRLEKKEVR
ncbi:hypothetical protein ICE98_02677 [Lactococcus lactis]|nr:hypothetical protein [Lactococcus lactis]